MSRPPLPPITDLGALGRAWRAEFRRIPASGINVAGGLAAILVLWAVYLYLSVAASFHGGWLAVVVLPPAWLLVARGWAFSRPPLMGGGLVAAVLSVCLPWWAGWY